MMQGILTVSLLIAAAIGAPPKGDQAPKGDKGHDKPTKTEAPAVTCELITHEAPRGGLLEVEGKGFGKTPLVRIGGKVTRIVERQPNKVSVQIPRDSDGGTVSVQAGKVHAECGTLTIIGKNG